MKQIRLDVLVEDLLEGNATIGPDGDIWYPCGPSGLSSEELQAVLLRIVMLAKKNKGGEK
jgi:hypothetical protein